MADPRQKHAPINPVMQPPSLPFPKARHRRRGGPFYLRKRFRILWIENNFRRRSNRKMRINNIITKAEDLSVLCNAEVCAVIYSPHEKEPVVFPSVGKAKAMCESFMQLPPHERKRFSLTHEQFLQETLEKKMKKVQEKMKEIEENETRILVYKALAGGDIRGIDSEASRKMKTMVEKMYDELYAKSSWAKSTAPAAQTSKLPSLKRE